MYSPMIKPRIGLRNENTEKQVRTGGLANRLCFLSPFVCCKFADGIRDKGLLTREIRCFGFVFIGMG